MRRREFIALVSAAAALPRVGIAQQVRAPVAQGGRAWLIGAAISLTSSQSDLDTLGPFHGGMADLGYVRGRDYVIEARYCDGDASRYAVAAQQIVALKPDVILTDIPQNVQPVTSAIPIAAFIGGSSAQALVDELIGNVARPKANVTGLVSASGSAALIGKRATLLIEVVPSIVRMGVLIYTLNPDGGQGNRDSAIAAGKAAPFTPIFVDVATPAELGAAFRSLSDQHVDAILVGDGNVFASDRARTVGFAAEVRLPAIYNEQGYVEAGGLISYGFDRKGTFTRLATTVDHILRGIRLADIPAESISYAMAINLKTARSLLLTVPANVLFRADEVIPA